MQELLIEKEAENERESADFAGLAISYFKKGDTVLLYGPLGSGKTFLTKIFVRLLGSNADVSSPSFTLINQYAGKIRINHIDLYRISQKGDIGNLGLDDIFNDDSIKFIEWPQIIERQIEWLHFRIYIETNNSRSSWRKFRLIKFYEEKPDIGD